MLWPLNAESYRRDLLIMWCLVRVMSKWGRCSGVWVPLRVRWGYEVCVGLDCGAVWDQFLLVIKSELIVQELWNVLKLNQCLMVWCDLEL